MDQFDTAIDLRAVLWKARQYRWLIVLPIVVALCVAFIYLKTADRLYSSRVVLSVADRPQISGTLQSIMNPDRPTDSPRDRIALLNTRVHETAFLRILAERLGITADGALRAEVESQARGLPGISVDDLVSRTLTSRLGRKLSVSAGAGSLVGVEAVDANPLRAREMATAAAGLLVEQARQMTLERAQARGAFSADQIAVYQERLRKSEDALRTYQESLIGRNISSSVVNDGNLDLARNLIRMNSEETDQIRARLQSERAAWTAAAGAGTVPPDLSSAAAASLEARLAELEINYALAQLGGERSAATATSLRTRVAETRQALYTELDAAAQGVAGDVSEDARASAVGMALDRAILRTLQGKSSRLNALVRNFASSVQSTPRDQLELERLRSAVDMNRQLLATLQKEVTSSRLSEALETSELGVKIDVVEAAQVPLYPVFPDRKKVFGIAAVLGPLMGIGLAFAVERLAGVIRTAEELEREIGSPVIGTVPRVEEWARPGGFLKNYWAPLSIMLVLLATGIFYAVYSSTHTGDRRPPAASVGTR